MPLQATSGAASYDAFGGGVAAVPKYIEDYFSTFLYTDNGSTQTINNGIDLAGKGGFVWAKCRSAVDDHIVWDSARGTSNYLIPNKTNAQATYAATFNSNGVSIPSLSTGQTYTSWSWAKAPKFFDVVTYTGNGVLGRQIPHNLGSVPGCIIVKRTNADASWYVYHRGVDVTSPQDYVLLLDQTLARINSSAPWNDTAPTATNFTVGDNSNYNGNGDTYVAYLFAHDAGGFGLTGTDNVISCGSYTGAGASTTVTLGYEPQWLLIKRTDTTGPWHLQDVMRGATVTATDNGVLYPNTSGAETQKGSHVFPTATGFAFTASESDINASGGTYIYIAIRRGPMKVPTSGTSVFYPNAYSGTGTDTTITSTGFPPDLFFSKARSFSSTFLNVMVDRLRGASQFLVPSNIIGETVGTNVVLSLNMNGVTLGSSSNANNGTVTYAQWNFRRAPSCFDIVCYSGTGSTLTVDHNLQATPELIIIKRRNGDSSTGWVVYSSTLGFSSYRFLNDLSSDTIQYLTATSSTTFTLNSGGYTDTNSSGNTYVAYLFATCAGVSKVFSYTGNGSSQTINCGFTGGARFVLIKRTDVSSGNWFVWDTARGIVSGNDPHLSLNTTAVEVTTDDSIDTNSTGFVVNQLSATNVNVSSATYIGLAIA